MTNQTHQVDEAVRPITSVSGLLCRIIWLFAGPALLCFLVMRIFTTSDGWLSAADIAFPLTIAATIAARWISFRTGDRTNSLGEVATPDQLWRYTVVLSAMGAFAWVVGNFLGNRQVS